MEENKMASRKRYLASQLGKEIAEPGAHIAHAAVGILLKKRRFKDREMYIKGGSANKPIKEYDPFPREQVRETHVVDDSTYGK
jgi:hypothetical protein